MKSKQFIKFFIYGPKPSGRRSQGYFGGVCWRRFITIIYGFFLVFSSLHGMEFDSSEKGERHSGHSSPMSSPFSSPQTRNARRRLGGLSFASPYAAEKPEILVNDTEDSVGFLRDTIDCEAPELLSHDEQEGVIERKRSREVYEDLRALGKHQTLPKASKLSEGGSPGLSRIIESSTDLFISPERVTVRKSKAPFGVLMGRFIKNLLLYANPDNQLISFVNLFFDITEDFSLVPKKKEEIEFDEIVLPEEDEEVLKEKIKTYILYFYDCCEMKRSLSRALIFLQEKKDEEDLEEDFFPSQPGLVFPSGDFASCDQIDESDERDRVKEIFKDIRKRVSSEYERYFNEIKSDERLGIFLFDLERYDNCAGKNSKSSEINEEKRICLLGEKLLEIINENQVANYYFIKNAIQRKFRELNELSDESEKEDIRKFLIRIYEVLCNKLNLELKGSFLIRYYFKPLLFIAKQIQNQLKLKSYKLELQNVVLIRDDHIFRLVYEEALTMRGIPHLAGGHFHLDLGTKVIDNSDADLDSEFFIKGIEEFFSNSDTGISVVDRIVFEKDEDENLMFFDCKVSSLFPRTLNMKYFHDYVEYLYSNKDVCQEDLYSFILMNSAEITDGLKRTVYLFKHKANKFGERYSSEHDVYIIMTCFKEVNDNGCDVETIWTVYPLGAHVICYEDIKDDFLLEIKTYNRNKKNKIIKKQEENGIMIPSYIIKKLNCLEIKRLIKEKIKAAKGQSSYYRYEIDGKWRSLIEISEGMYIDITSKDIDSLIKD